MPALFLLPTVGRGVCQRMADLPDKAMQRPCRKEFMEDLRTPGIARLLTVGADYAGLFAVFAVLTLAGAVIAWSLVQMLGATQRSAEK